MSTTTPPRTTLLPRPSRHRAQGSHGSTGPRSAHLPPGRGRAARHLGDVLRALGAAAVLLALLLGPPVLLWQMAPLLLPEHLPAVADIPAALMAPDDGTLFLQVLALVVAGCWASFVIAVVVDVLTRMRGWRLPHLPLISVQQRTAGGLVTAVAVLFAAPVAVAGPPQLPVVATAPPAPMAASPVTTTSPASPPTVVPVMVEVAVHRGDTLWGIAEQQLGSGTQYPRLAEATRGVTQPDGRRLQDANDIYPGWVVMVPMTAPAAPASTTDDASPAPTDGPAPSPTASADSGTNSLAPSAAGDQATTAVPPTDSGAPARTPADDAPRVTDRALPGDDTGDDASTADESASPDLWALGTGAALTGLTAAGVVGILRRRRSRQQRHRRTGQRLPVAPPAAQDLQRQVHARQDPFTVEQLDGVLRALSARCHRDGTELPDVQAVRLNRDWIELHLGSPANPVTPFTAATGPESTWHLDRGALPEQADAPDGAPAPCPTLAVIGRDLDDALVLVDLESVGELVVSSDRGPGTSGEDDEVEAVLSAVIIDLATSPWGAEADVTVVSPLHGLVAALEVDHVEQVDDMDALLADLEAWAVGIRRVLEGSSSARAAAGRPLGDQADALRPQVLVLDVSLSTTQQERLSVMLSEASRLPLMVVSTRAVTGTAWSLTLDAAADLAVLQPMGLRLCPQRLGADARRLLASAVRVASTPAADVPEVKDVRTDALAVSTEAVDGGASEPSAPADQAIASLPASGDAGADEVVARWTTEPPKRAEPNLDDPTGGSTTSSTSPATVKTSTPPMVAVLGPVEVRGTRDGAAPSNNLSTMIELVAVLALYPNSQPHLLDSMLWPGERVPRTRRNQLISRTRRWLGRDAASEHYLPLAQAEGYRLAAAVRSDWDDFRELAGDRPEAVATERLIAALDLVRGQPFAGVNPCRYAWADVPKQSMIEVIVDVAQEVTERALADGDAALARRAAAIGLLAEPGYEALWRGALSAEHLAGNRPAVQALVKRFTSLAEELGDDLEEETRALITSLLHGPNRDRDDLSERIGHEV